MSERDPRVVNRCHGDRDGDCNWIGCPQMFDGEPEKTGRHCPLDIGCPRCGFEFDECNC